MMRMKEKLGESWRMSDFGWPLLANLTPLRQGAAQPSRWRRGKQASWRPPAKTKPPKRTGPSCEVEGGREGGREDLIVELVSEQA